MNDLDYKDQLYGGQYLGASGTTQSCIEAIVKIIQSGDKVIEAKLITTPKKHHAFILTINYGERLVIKSGFASGYLGEGARGLSTALQLFKMFEIKVTEYEVPDGFINRLEQSALTNFDLDSLEKIRPQPPSSIFDYIHDYSSWKFESHKSCSEKNLQQEFTVVMPYAIIDLRIMDLAKAFFENPDFCITTAFRRLEGVVKSRAELDLNGTKLFSNALRNEDSKLYWEGINKSENEARGNMFISIWGAYRNPRMHKEREMKEQDYLREFLLINELYLLERSAVQRPQKEVIGLS